MFRFPGKMPKVFFFIKAGFFTRMSHSVIKAPLRLFCADLLCECAV